MLISQPANGYRYNSDSIFLYQFISRLKPKGSVLDIGCGVGILSALIMRDFDVQMDAIEIQPEMLEFAKFNYLRNGLDVQTYLGDISDFDEDVRYDFVVSNPPFYDSSVIQSENSVINVARYTHNMPLEELVKSVKRVLKNRGYFVLCYDAKQVDVLLCELRGAGINPEILRFVHPKIDREAKIVMLAARVGSKSMLKVLPPMVVFDNDDNYTAEAKSAMSLASTVTQNVTSIPEES